jgi:hypothetical protein
MKHMFITLMATVPILATKILRFGGERLKWFGVYINFTLMINILWTVLPFETKPDQDVSTVNGIMAILLVVALAVRIVALHVRKAVQCELDESGVFLLHSTSLPWLVSYTTWNVIFAIYWGSGLGMFGLILLQDILFWPVMCCLHRSAHCSHSLETYFVSARALTLGFWVAFQTWSYWIPAFEKCPAEPQWNQDDFAVFIEYLNILFICIVIAREIRGSRGKQSQADPKKATISESDFEPQAFQASGPEPGP